VLDTRDELSTGTGQDLTDVLERWITDHSRHPYALAGLDALRKGISCLQEICAEAGLNYVGNLKTNHRLPTALGTLIPAALAPDSFVAGDARLKGEMLIAGPTGWRDFYPKLCADNLARQGIAARAAVFDLPEATTGKFDATPVGLARLFEHADVRARVAAQLKPKLDGAARVGLPAVLGLEGHAEAWHDLQDQLGVPVFEIPTLPPSVPGIRLYGAFRRALLSRDPGGRSGCLRPAQRGSSRPKGVPPTLVEDPAGCRGAGRNPGRSGVRILFDMTVTRGLTESNRAVGVAVPSAAREAIYRADRIVLATGGLYGGGITSNHRGEMREAVFDLPLSLPNTLGEQSTGAAHTPDLAFGEAEDEVGRAARAGAPEWFDERFLSERGHPIHLTGVRANANLQPVNEAGTVVLENVRVAGRLLADYNPVIEGSAEGVWLATAYRAVT
jgi:glycerol-3-phosphate dehydrogenase subunit B